jgi:hypothetical protein
MQDSRVEWAGRLADRAKPANATSVGFTVELLSRQCHPFNHDKRTDNEQDLAAPDHRLDLCNRGLRLHDANPSLREVEACVIAASRCEACVKINTFDALSLDCDLADDLNTNGSCP